MRSAAGKRPRRNLNCRPPASQKPAKRDSTSPNRRSSSGAHGTRIVECSQDAIISKSLDSTILTWNPAAERLYGWSAQEAVGKPVSLIIPPERAGELTEIVQKLQGSGRVEPFETVRLRKDGRRVPVSLSVSPIRDAGGRVAGASVIARDVTEQKCLEEQFRQAQKMEAVGRLAGGVAHDFNNLLCVINGYSDLLLDALGPDDPLRGLAGEIRKAGERSASLTRQLLAFSRKQLLAPRVLDLNAVVADLEKMLLRVIGEDVDLATNPAAGLWPVRSDPGQVEQVLMNLAVNARDAMPRGGKLTIETRNVELDEGYASIRAEVRPGPYVQLAVSDTGHGMTAEVRARIFEPFFTTKEVGKGTGLGLATVYGIVKQSGGHVEVYSEPGLGTTFKVYLPRAGEEPRRGKSHPGVAPAPRGSETVLLVEDAEAVRALTSHVLRAQGYTVLEGADGGEALRVCEQHPGRIDLLATDVVMPEVGGRQLAEQLVRLHPEMKVLYLSGYTDDAVVRYGILEAEVHFLQKPFTTLSLARKVREVLESAQESPAAPV